MTTPIDSFSFFNEKGDKINHLTCERTEQLQAYKYVPEDAKGVLELGARYGTVTCAISEKINKRPVLITVEPDPDIWDALEKNLTKNSANAYIIKGAISKKSVGLVHLDYGTFTTVDMEKSLKQIYDVIKTGVEYYSTVPTWTLQQIQEKTNIPVIDTLVADCEGFLEQFFDENPELYKTLNTVIFEKDFSERCNYPKIQWHLHKYGLREVIGGSHAVWIRPGAGVGLN